MSRLTTQDRIYAFGAFPINIVNGFANKRKILLFEKDNTVYPVYTQIPKQIPAEYRLLQAEKIDELSLDHDDPVEKELKKVIHTMPTLQLLSADIRDFKKTYKKNHKKADNRTVLAAYKKRIPPINEAALIQEIQQFLKMLSITIMQRNLNSSKSNRI